MTDFIKTPVVLPGASSDPNITKGIFDYIGSGVDPTTVLVNAAPGSTYRRVDGAPGGMLWQRTTGGWEALQTSAWNQAAADARYVQLAGSTMNGGARLVFPTLTTNSQLQIGTIEAQGYALNNAWVGENLYYDGSNYKYRATGGAAQLVFSGSLIEFRVYASGSAGSTITQVNAYSFSPTTSIFNNQGTITLGTPTTYAMQFSLSGSVKLTIGVDATRTYLQSWGSQPLFLNNQGNAVQVGSYLAVGSNYAGGARSDGDIVARRSSTTGALYFGDSTSQYLYWDGTTYYLSAASGNASLNLTGGTLIGNGVQTSVQSFMSTTSASDSYTTGALQMREKSLAGAGSGTVNEAPRIAWYWSGRNAGQLAFYSDATFRFWGQDSNAYRSIYFDSAVVDSYVFIQGAIFGSGYGKGLIGTYDQTKYRCVYAMGSSFLPNVNGVALGTAGGNGVYGLFNLYDATSGGINATGHTLSHGFAVVTNGAIAAFIGTGFYTTGFGYFGGSVSAPDFVLT